MITTPKAIPIPAASVLSAACHDAQFADSYQVRFDPGNRPMLAVAVAMLVHTPGWVDRAMRLRNAIVKRLGLKDLGDMRQFDVRKPIDSYRVGDRIGIFTLLRLSDDEVVLGDDDRHLDVQVSVLRLSPGPQASVAVSTVVHVHNGLGRLYMAVVGPAHKLIAPAMLRRAHRWSMD